jgi:REP element-mobilizing transposase RayT
MSSRRPDLIAHHLIWTLYGHWLVNDLRGSGSSAIREEKFESLGPIFYGRKPARIQPSRQELKTFHKQAESLLKHPRFWIDDTKRQTIAEAFAEVIASRAYTVWACAVLKNHAHMVIRRHRDDATHMWRQLAETASVKLRQFVDISADHPVWFSRPYKVFLKTPDEVRGRIAYVELNPEKEGLSRQQYAFVQQYNNWPFHKIKSGMLPR